MVFTGHWKIAPKVSLEQKDIYCPKISKFTILIWLLPNGHKYELGNAIIILYEQYLYNFVTSVYILKWWNFKAMELDILVPLLTRLQCSDGQYFGGSTKAGFAQLSNIQRGHQIHFWKTMHYICHSQSQKAVSILFDQIKFTSFLKQF